MANLGTRVFNASIVTVLLMPAAAAWAGGRPESYAYIGGGLGSGTASLTSKGYLYLGNPDDSVGLAEFHVGYRANRYFALEGQLLGVANDQSQNDQQISYGGFSGRALVLAPLNDAVEIYGLLGFDTGNSEIAASDTTHESGVVYGGGLQMTFGERRQFTVRGSYEVYEGSQLLDRIQVAVFGFQYNFVP